MNVAWSPDDDELLQLIKDDTATPPPWVGEYAELAWAWRDPDVSVAGLVDDSAFATTTRAALTRERTVEYALGSTSFVVLLRDRLGDHQVEVTTLPSVSVAISVTVVSSAGTEVQSIVTDEQGTAVFGVPLDARFSLRADIDGTTFVTPLLTV